ncbi:glycerol-3-phosphate dehydrogenase/oxidase, partial [Photobacterium sagamiensis]|uniref:glycerol-3-phosphate dehydrogenase/oxidase n=1 Tax=Photobacterium sagamiensis TaxID=2910241 RepID=UPI003D0D2B47
MTSRTLHQAASDFKNTLSMNNPGEFDLVIIGGGITGAGIFHLATAQGLKVLLLEQRDFAWGTSSRSSKMVHGGLRYLATGQWRLTRDAAQERERMIAQLPGLVEVMPYLMLHRKGEFPHPMLFSQVLNVYDKLAKCRHHRALSITQAKDWLPFLNVDQICGVSLFADATTDDARLVLRLLQDGVLAGGAAINYAQVNALMESDGESTGVKVQFGDNPEQYEINAKVVINAAGAWAAKLHPLEQGVLRPLRGSHLVLPFERLPVPACISFFHPEDKRPVFIFPWEGCTVIGTTDLDHDVKLNQEPRINKKEVDYLLTICDRLFPHFQIKANDVISCWSGVRPIFSTDPNLPPSKEKRDHLIWQKPGLISVSGGKLTTYNLMAQQVLDAAKQQKADLFKQLTTAQFSQPEHNRYVDKRLHGHFGAFAEHIADMSKKQEIGISRYQWRELEWSLIHECVTHLDDLLLRRTRLGLLLGKSITQYKSLILA